MVRLGAQFQDLTFDGCFADLTGWQIHACIETSLAQATAVLLEILLIKQLCFALIARETLSVEDFPLSMNALTSDRLVTKSALWRLFFPIMAWPAFEIGVIVTKVRSVNTITTNRAKETLVVQRYTIDYCVLSPNGFFAMSALRRSLVLTRLTQITSIAVINIIPCNGFLALST